MVPAANILSMRAIRRCRVSGFFVPLRRLEAPAEHRCEKMAPKSMARLAESIHGSAAEVNAAARASVEKRASLLIAGD